jgi:hypothetical protein
MPETDCNVAKCRQGHHLEQFNFKKAGLTLPLVEDFRVTINLKL